MATEPKLEMQMATDGGDAELENLMNKRTGFQLNLSPNEKKRLKAAAGTTPLAQWIRDIALREADKITGHTEPA